MADDPLHNGSVPANELRQVQSLLWTVIVERLNPAEVDEVRVPSSRRRRRLSTHPLVPSTRDHPFPLLLSQVRRALGSSTIDENEQLMSEADALAEIIGDVRHRTDTRAHARRLYENPNRALVEGELRLLVRSIRRCASGDFADAARPPSARRERDISWSDIGNGGDADPSRAASELEPEDEPSRRAAKAPAPIVSRVLRRRTSSPRVRPGFRRGALHTRWDSSNATLAPRVVATHDRGVFVLRGFVRRGSPRRRGSLRAQHKRVRRR